ncbi:O-antigen ligase family protein [Comamonas aquatica]|uniref:O-antigen ligase family protein n=1 Tax=Comamonas aquatica TaxID=225991 RepID=UPI00244B1A39|nr:O-antigen ligase family protein [Comamonas aquatica]MDH0382568.1 O-antigen ligase family protein [Comamonas aquatica]MDH0430622.1 O-antigen ligase family protein [Comamonas aquatica]MDH0941492.1 O-antigen ligase family protein [Comamonas aquatica]
MQESLRTQMILRKFLEVSIFLSFLLLPFTLAGHNVFYTLAVVAGMMGGIWWSQKNWLLREPLVWALGFLFLLVCVGSFYSLSTWDAALGENFNKYLKLFLGIIFIAALKNEVLRKRAFLAFYAGMVFLLACTYLNIWIDLPWSLTKNRGWGVDHTVFGNYITQNIMMSFFVLQNFFLFAKFKPFPWKWLFALLAVLAVVSILYLSNGRTGYLVLFAGTFAYLIFALPKRLVGLGILGVIIVCSIAFATSPRVQERYERAHNETVLLFEQYGRGELPTFTSIGARWYMWIKSLELVQERPWTGWGLGSHGIKWCEKAPEPDWCGVGDTTPHNQFIFFAVELGILGVLGFLFLLGALIWGGWHGGMYRPLMMGFIAIFIGDSLVNASLWNAREYNFFIIMMCLLYSMTRAQAEGNMTDVRGS